MLNLPTPSSISGMWNIGFVLGSVLSVQVARGVLLSMSFVTWRDETFYSVIHMIRDLNIGWLIRFFHSSLASFFFLFMYAHISRGIFFGSFGSKARTWFVGVLILIFVMASAFFGYVLPWGQISYWGATVITNMASAIPYIGGLIVEWLWGNFSVSQPTLNRFFSIHFFLPFVVLVLSISHIFFLHITGSSNPIGTEGMVDKVEFSYNFFLKDLLFLLVSVFFLFWIILNVPFLFMDPENMNQADPIKAPVHIQPEWYFLFAYAILRSVPSKLGGVIMLVLSVGVLLLLPLKSMKILSIKFSPIKKFEYFLFLSSFLVLTLVGMKPVEYPYLTIGKVWRFVYFLSLV